MKMTEYEAFMVYELDDSGEKVKLAIEEENLQENLLPEQVLVIIREDLRRIFIWKGPKSPVRKRFISSRVASALQEDLMKDARYHRCKIVSVDAGDEPTEFLNAFRLESMEVTERLADMHYVRNIERERMEQATITDVAPKTIKSQPEEEYYSPALQDTSNEVVVSSLSASTPKTRTQYQKPAMAKPSRVPKTMDLSEEHKKTIKEKILKAEVSDGYKRLNLILGHTLYAAVSKTAKVFGKEVEETDWEPVKTVPKGMVELEDHILRVYFNEEKGIVEAVEVLEKSEKPKSTSKKTTTTDKVDTTNEMTDFNSMTVKDLKTYAEEKKIDLPANARKSEIIEILEKSKEKKPSGRKQLPKIPSSDD